MGKQKEEAQGIMAVIVEVIYKKEEVISGNTRKRSGKKRRHSDQYTPGTET